MDAGTLTPRFEFATSARIVFGAGTAEGEAPRALRAAGATRVLVVTGARRGAARAQPIAAAIEREGLPCATVAVRGEPTIERASICCACKRSVGDQ